MSFIDLIKKRYSLRKYSKKSVPRVYIERCIEAARLAPSACNSQPWEFIVIDFKKLKDKLTKAAFSGIYKMNTFAKDAPVIIVVITKGSGTHATLGGLVQRTSFNLIDVGIAVEHLCIQASEDNLGTCMLGWFNGKAVKRVLNLPKSTRIDLLISMGYPQDEKVPDKKRESLDTVFRYNI
ncbi:nitroreductase family protein [bacterium]|nr:nitroreductase family protein [bacterium]